MTLLSRKHIDDNDFVARYLANRLSEEERESFEAYYLAHPEMLQELNRTAQFKAGLMDLEQSGELAHSMRPLPWWHSRSYVALAATLVLVMGGSVWFNWFAKPDPLMADSLGPLTNLFQPKLAIAGTYNIQRTRSSFYDATVNLPDNSAAVELRIKPETAASPALYRVTLSQVAEDESTTTLTSITGLQPAADGFVEVYVNTSKLTPAVYELQIAGEHERAGTAASSFLFELVGDVGN